jgi:hypothetical protein
MHAHVANVEHLYAPPKEVEGARKEMLYLAAALHLSR